MFGAAVLSSYGYDQLNDPWTYDPDKAVELLDSAGIVDTDGDGYRELDGEKIQLNYLAYSSRNLDEFAQAVAITLESLGIGCKVTVQDYDTALANQSAGNFDMITSTPSLCRQEIRRAFWGIFIQRIQPLTDITRMTRMTRCMSSCWKRRIKTSSWS